MSSLVEVSNLKKYFEITKIESHPTHKVARVEGILQSRYAAGYIVHRRKFPDYENQLINWPNEKKDGPDVFSMCVQLLDPFAAYASDPDEDDLAEDEYPPLEAVIGDYRNM